MIDIPNLSGPMQPPASGGAARHAVVLLHGYGADGNDLIGLALRYLQKAFLMPLFSVLKHRNRLN